MKISVIIVIEENSIKNSTKTFDRTANSFDELFEELKIESIESSIVWSTISMSARIKGKIQIKYYYNKQSKNSIKIYGIAKH